MLGQEGQDSYRRRGKAGESQGRAAKRERGSLILHVPKQKWRAVCGGMKVGLRPFSTFAFNFFEHDSHLKSRWFQAL